MKKKKLTIISLAVFTVAVILCFIVYFMNMPLETFSQYRSCGGGKPIRLSAMRGGSSKLKELKDEYNSIETMEKRDEEARISRGEPIIQQGCRSGRTYELYMF